MGNISASKLGGLGLIIGPGLATILYLLLFMVLGDASGEVTDFSVTSYYFWYLATEPLEELEIFR